MRLPTTTKDGRTRLSLAGGLASVAAALLVVLPAGAWAAVTIASSQPDGQIAYGQSVTVRGAVSPPRQGRSVALQYAPAGQHWRAVARASTGGGGSFRLTAQPPYSGRLRAVDAAGSGVSAARSVTVRAALFGSAAHDVLRGRRLTVWGAANPAVAGRTVVLARRIGRRWTKVSSARTQRDGTYALRLTPRRLGGLALRMRFAGDARNAAATKRLPNVNVYRRARATWFGPGLYGNYTACGELLTRHTLGVAAHRSIPCGALVRFRYRGRTVRVPVIDRGNFAPGLSWDLTYATKRALRFPDAATVWSTR